MTYNIFSKTTPKMPKLGKGTNFIKFILSKASKDMYKPLVPLCIPALTAHLSEVCFTYSDNKNSTKSPTNLPRKTKVYRLSIKTSTLFTPNQYRKIKETTSKNNFC